MSFDMMMAGGGSGGFSTRTRQKGRRLSRNKREGRAKKRVPELRVFINRAPWNELLLLGLKGGWHSRHEVDPKTGKDRIIDIRYEGVKWRSWETHVRGLVVLYTAKSKTDDHALYEEGLLPNPEAEAHVDYDPKHYKYTKQQLLRGRGKLVGVAEIVHGDDDGYIYMNNIKRFPKPMPYSVAPCVNWGRAPFALVENQLRKIGMLKLAHKFMVL